MDKKKISNVNITDIEYEIVRKEQEIINLESVLTSNSSDIGDYKIIQGMDCHAWGLAWPYDINELNEKRQAVRDQINVLEDEIVELQTQIDGAVAE